MPRIRSLFVLSALLVCGSLLAPVVRADEPNLLDPSAPKRPVPIAVVTLSSIERVLENMDYMFASVERPELSDVAVSMLTSVRDLKGVDRNRPLGLMIFLKPGLLPTPDFVGFIPTDDFDELLQTFAVGPVQPAKVPDRENRYSLENPGETIYFEKMGNDVFIAVNEDLLDQELPDPIEMTKALTTRYDLAAQLRVNAVPLGMRNVLLDFLRAAIEAESQQRDDEPAEMYRVRKAYGDGNLRFLEQLLLQGDSFTIGVDVSPELKTAIIEMDLNARPGSEFAQILGESGGKSSYFRPLQTDPAILSFSMSSKMDKDTIKTMTEIVTNGKKSIEIAMAEDPQTKDKALRLDGLADTFLATIEAGLLDGFFRIQRGEESGKHTMIGSIRVVAGTQSAQTIGDIFQLVTEVEQGEIGLERNVLEHQGVIFHRVIPLDRDNMSNRIFGDNWAMYFGAGERTLWFVLGGDDALPAVQAAIDKVVDPASQRDLAGTAPVQFSLSMSQWIGMWSEPDREQRGIGKALLDNFATGQDRLVIDVTPKENGIRYRIRFEEGFLRALGIIASRQADELLGNPTDE